MAYGVPYLAADVGAIRDCCENNPDSILVRPDTTALREGLMQLVQKLIDNQFSPERLKAYYERQFSRGVMQQRWRECLQSPKVFFNAS
jgi:hypothetical protein